MLVSKKIQSKNTAFQKLKDYREVLCNGKCWYFWAVGRKLKSSPITVISVSGEINFKDVDFERKRKFNSEF